MMQALLTGMLVGFFIAMPLGPVSLTCIRNAVRDGPLAGVMGGLGAASAHAVFATVAGLGATTLAALMTNWQRPISLASAGLLIGLGLVHLSRSLRPRTAPAPGAAARAMGAYPVSLALALSNPMTILPYLAAGPSLATVPDGPDLRHVLAMAMGAALGSGGWYLTITGATLLARPAVQRAVTDRLDILSGVALVGFGCVLATRHA